MSFLDNFFFPLRGHGFVPLKSNEPEMVLDLATTTLGLDNAVNKLIELVTESLCTSQLFHVTSIRRFSVSHW